MWNNSGEICTDLDRRKKTANKQTRGPRWPRAVAQVPQSATGQEVLLRHQVPFVRLLRQTVRARESEVSWLIIGSQKRNTSP